jgi:hypothetical protein
MVRPLSDCASDCDGHSLLRRDDDGDDDDIAEGNRFDGDGTDDRNSDDRRRCQCGNERSETAIGKVMLQWAIPRERENVRGRRKSRGDDAVGFIEESRWKATGFLVSREEEVEEGVGIVFGRVDAVRAGVLGVDGEEGIEMKERKKKRGG